MQLTTPVASSTSTSSHPDDAFGLLDASFSGDQKATVILSAIVQKSAHVAESARAKDPTICLLCPRAVLDAIPCTFCVIAPSIAAPDMVIASVICPKCAQASDLMAKVTQAYRELWPSLRQIQVGSAGNA
jgi:hypothetical protein